MPNDLLPVNELAARLGIGGNAPPLDEVLTEELADDQRLADELIEVAKTAKIGDAADAAKVTIVIAKLRDHERAVDQKRDARKRPHLEAGRTIDRAHQAVIAPMTAARETLTKLLTQFERRREEEAARERARIEAEQREAEERARQAREEAEAMKGTGGGLAADLAAIQAEDRADALARQATATRPEPIRTTGASATLQRQIAFSIVDDRKALGWLYKNRKSEILQAARTILGSHLRSMGVDNAAAAVIPGVQVTIEKHARVR